MVQENRDPRAYELMTILVPDMAEEDTAAATERMLGYITAQGGEITNNSVESPWGRRRLAYTMRFQGVDYRDGFYILTHFSAPPHVIGEIERELKLDTQVIRYLLVMDDPRMGEHPKDEDQQSGDEEETPATASTTETPAAAPVAETAETIEGEENPAPADAPASATAETTPAGATEANSTPAEAPVARRSSKLPTEGEGTDWVAGDGADNLPEGFPLKGNASSKIYHPKESPNYSNTIAEIYFATPEAAEQHGYRLPKVLQNAGAAASETVADTAKAAAEATGANEEE